MEVFHLKSGQKAVQIFLIVINYCVAYKLHAIIITIKSGT